MKIIVAKWETTGKDFLDLYKDDSGYGYMGHNQCGNLGTMKTDDDAIRAMEVGPVAVLKSDRRSLRRTL
jgi:hypothetical protein